MSKRVKNIVRRFLVLRSLVDNFEELNDSNKGACAAMHIQRENSKVSTSMPFGDFFVMNHA